MSDQQSRSSEKTEPTAPKWSSPKSMGYHQLGPLPTSKEYDGIMVVVDRFSKMARYIPVTVNITSKRIARTLWERVFKDTTIPRKVISDRGPQFVSNFMRELCNQLGIERNPSTRPIIPKLTVRQREPTRKWNNTFSCMSATDKTTGPSGYRWPNSPTTTGNIRTLGDLHSSWISEGTQTSMGMEKHRLKRCHRWTNLSKGYERRGRK